MRSLLLSGFALLASLLQAEAVPPLEQLKSQGELDRALAALDREVFDAYNKCDLEKFAAYFADDVEFYHDQGGVTRGLQSLKDSLKKNICGGDVQREVVPGSLEAHLMKGYGAIQIGVHRFLHPKSGERPGIARFVHLWQSTKEGWKITRVLSFDHKAERP